jgi:general secretion pathway protein F
LSRAREQARQLPRQLAILLGAGLTLEEALDVVARDGALPIASRLLDRLRRGEALSDAMGGEGSGGGQVFDSLSVALVRAGEASGDLAGAMSRLGEHLQARDKVLQSLRTAALYPLLVVGVAVIVIAILLGFVVPRFQPLIAQLGGDAPLASRMVMGLAAGWPIGVSVMVGMVLIIAAIVLAPGLRRWRDGAVFALPLFGTLARRVECERWARGVATLTAGGVELSEALSITGGVLSNSRAVAAADHVASGVREGRALATVMAESGLFPGLVVRLAKAGDEAARLSDGLSSAADLLGEEIDRTLRRVIALIEPATIIVLGGLVALIVVGLLSTVTALNDLMVR